MLPEAAMIDEPTARFKHLDIRTMLYNNSQGTTEEARKAFDTNERHA